MRFSTLLATFTVVATGASAQSISDALTLTAANHYNAPIPPWEPGHTPGWYYGQGPAPDGIVCVLTGLLCEILELLPFCLQCPKPAPPPPPQQPPPPPEYSPTFYNLTCASQDGSYLTYGLVDTVADCQAMCDTVTDCVFLNTYHDNNGKDGSPQLTCSLFSQCLEASSADNCGGQTQPDGSVDFITASDGYCKN
ncbi:hypothetical protein GGX14DRAFT_646313 [Mycena pura]|uniref:Apple domain-containing protein n=1 Tax=Mycena pura TaxID=153505 RepID=A0AAD6YBZ4_9AGAR|nr:hypothetical protein GGX14DRAFT_646313 [Mycena pura]